MSPASYQGIASQVAEKLGVALDFWVAQRFTAAISDLFSERALAAAGSLRGEKYFFCQLSSDAE